MDDLTEMSGFTKGLIVGLIVMLLFSLAFMILFGPENIATSNGTYVCMPNEWLM